jgi:hypothetical protein
MAADGADGALRRRARWRRRCASCARSCAAGRSGRAPCTRARAACFAREARCACSIKQLTSGLQHKATHHCRATRTCTWRLLRCTGERASAPRRSLSGSSPATRSAQGAAPRSIKNLTIKTLLVSSTDSYLGLGPGSAARATRAAKRRVVLGCAERFSLLRWQRAAFHPCDAALCAGIIAIFKFY